MLRARSVEEYLAERPNEPEWLIDGMVPRGGLTVVIAKPKTGKSILAAQVANALANNVPLLGRQVFEPRRVLYVQLDAPPEDWRKLLRQTHLGGFHVLDFYDIPRYFLDSASKVGELREYVKAKGYTYVIWDALEKLTKLDLNPVLGMQTALDRIQNVWPGPRMVIHHPRKGAGGDYVDNLVDAGAGSHYLTGEASAIWGLAAGSRTKGTLTLGGRFLDEKLNLGRDGCPEPGGPCPKDRCQHTYLWTPAPPRAPVVRAPGAPHKYEWPSR